MLAAVLTASAVADSVRIVTWNVYSCKSIAEVDKRGDDFKQAFEVMQPDILLLQEVNSKAVVERILRNAGQQVSAWHVVCTEFSPGDGEGWGDLEVAIASRYPITSAIEYDPQPDGNTTSKLTELPLAPNPKLGIEPVTAHRGFLWARIGSKQLTLICMHLKSSRGKHGVEDYENAKQREYVAGAIAACVLDDQRMFPQDAQLVAGDMNVGVRDRTKNGERLDEDCLEDDCAGLDGYDDTHALLRAGLVGGLRMHNLFNSHQMSKQTTYPGFPGSPIDNIYVSGGGAYRFHGARIVVYPAGSTAETFGSDHRPVLAIYSAP